MDEMTLGGEPGTGQDATVILVSRGGNQTLALIHLHSHVLRSHSLCKDFISSERRNTTGVPSVLLEFVLEVHVDLQHYFDCFSIMYSPVVKTFNGVEHGLELLKVASQIEFQELMQRISLYLSCMSWTNEEEAKVREYAASPDFPREHLKDLASRLGLDETEDDRHAQWLDLIRHCTRRVLNASSPWTLPAFLEAMACDPPCDHSKKVFSIISQEAKDIFVEIGNDWHGKIPAAKSTAYAESTVARIQLMSRILEASLKSPIAEELVQAIVHLDDIPTYVKYVSESRSVLARTELAKLVLVMFKEVVSGRLLLRQPERMALLVNWHRVLKSSLETATYEPVTVDLISTLSLKQQTKLLASQCVSSSDLVSTSSLVSMVLSQSQRSLGRPG